MCIPNIFLLKWWNNRRWQRCSLAADIRSLHWSPGQPGTKKNTNIDTKTNTQGSVPEKLTERKEWDALYLLLLSALIGQSCCRGYQCKENNSSADFSKSWEEKLNEDFPHSRCRPTLRNVSGNFSLSNQTHAISSPKKTFFLLQDKWTHETNDNNCVDTRVFCKINFSTKN